MMSLNVAMPEITERITLGDPGTPVYRSEPHVARYRYTEDFIEDGMTVLDMGCGTGYGDQHLEGAGAARVLGVDYSDEALVYARSTFGSAISQYARGFASSCPLADDAFDVIVCMEAIEHFPDIDVFLKEVRRVLKPGGMFLVSTPNKLFHSPHTDEPLNPYHSVEFTLAEFEHILGAHFTVERMLGQQPQDTARSVAQRFSPPAWLKRLLLSLPLVQNYFAQSADVFVDEEVGNCRFFYAVCRNAKS